jgi:hypothetical protein
MHRLLLVVALLGSACKKDTSSGLPPSKDWQAGEGEAPAKPSTPGMPQGANPHGGADPHAGVPGAPPIGGGGGNSDPHAGVPGAPPLGGGGGGDMAGGNNPHGGGAAVPNTMPQPTDPKTLEKTADGRLVLGPFTLVPPKEWSEKPITSSMRAAQFTWSEKSGEQAELVVYYFGEGGAGGVEANLERWLGQISQPDGKPSKDIAKIEKTKFAGQDSTIVSVGGRLTTQQMPGGPPPVDMPDAMLLAAIVNSPKGPYYFKATGSKKTVEANNAKFRAMLASMKLK